jgi:glycosyltransferase involved in cell wall biosynthesis
VNDDAKPTVLLLHNRYREPGGEERSVAAIASLLRSRGHEVETLERSSSDLAGARGHFRAGRAMLLGGESPGDVGRAVRSSGADIVHAHNVHPLFGARAVAAARAAGADVVLHLHNYRLFCAVAIGYRDGDECMRCRGRNTLPGLRLRCRGSVGEAAVYAAGLASQQHSLLERVERFVAPSRAAAERLVAYGLSDDRLDVLHNFLPDSDFASESKAREGRYALYVGRLAEEKGVDTAIAAARRAGVPLVIAGDGPQSDRLRQLAGDGDVRFTGRLEAAQVAELRAGAAFAIVPSRWHEPCPYAAIEAMAAGLPLLVSDVGGLPEIAGDEAVLPARDANAWSSAMSELWAHPDRREHVGAAALARARRLFGEDRFYRGLSAVYRMAALA